MQTKAVIKLKRKDSPATIFIYTFLVIVVLIAVFPIAISVFLSFQPMLKEGLASKISLTNMTLQNYNFILRASSFGRYITNSIIVSTFTVIFVLVIGSPAAYGLVRSRFKGSKSLLMWIIGLRMFPPVAVVIPFFIIASMLKQLDKLSTLVLLNIAFNLPLVMWIMAQIFRQIPRECEEAAAIDGCNEVNLFIKIALPLSVPGLIAAAALSFIFSWNEFMFALTLTTFEARTVPLAFTEYMSPTGIQFGRMYAGLVIAISPVLLFLFLLNRYVIKGLLVFTGGSVEV